MVNAHFVTDSTVVNVRSEQQIASVNVNSNIIAGRVGVSAYPQNLEHDKLSNRSLADQHPISAITGLQEALDRADTYIHEQGIASAEWVINHNLNKYPSVTVVDSADNEIIVSVRYVDANTCIINLTSPFKGKAYLN